MSVWDRRKEILYGNGSVGEVSRTSSTPECEVNSTENYDSWMSVIIYEHYPWQRTVNNLYHFEQVYMYTLLIHVVANIVKSYLEHLDVQYMWTYIKMHIYMKQKVEKCKICVKIWHRWRKMVVDKANFKKRSGPFSKLFHSKSIGVVKRLKFRRRGVGRGLCVRVHPPSNTGRYLCPIVVQMGTQWVQRGRMVGIPTWRYQTWTSCFS